jgi:hypothetical protein
LFFVVPFCKIHFSYADSPVESIYFLAAKSSAGGQDVCGTDVTQTAVAAPAVKVTSPKRSDGTYTTPFRVTFSTDGTAGVFVTYVENRERRGAESRGEKRERRGKVSEEERRGDLRCVVLCDVVCAVLRTRVLVQDVTLCSFFLTLRYTTKIVSVDSSGSTALARDPDEDDFPVSSGSSGGKVDLRYNGKIVVRAKSFKSGCLPSPVTEVVLVARKETQADIGDADRPEKGMTKVRTAVHFNASFVDGFNFQAFEIALYVNPS